MTGHRAVPHRRRALMLVIALAASFAAVGGQLMLLGARGGAKPHSDSVEPEARMVSRPDIFDRAGRLLAADVTMPSLYADPAKILDRDEAAEKLAGALPGLDQAQVLTLLQDRAKRFVWIKHGLTEAEVEKVRDLGLPAVSFRDELRRTYPGGEELGAVLGFVDGDNRGAAGIERFIDAQGLSEATDDAARGDEKPVILSIDLSVQHALREELAKAQADFDADAAAGLVLDLKTGEVLADASLPDYAAGDAAGSLDPSKSDRISAGAFELGSVFKTVTLAMAEDLGVLTPGKLFDATKPLAIGAYTIDDFHPTRRALTAEEVFLHSSNIGASLMAEEIGDEKMRAFLEKAGLTGPMTTELGRAALPLVPERWSRTSALTISFGHGIALSPLQFAVAAAGLVRAEGRVQPTFLKAAGAPPPGDPVIEGASKAFLADLLRANVVKPEGTGKRAQAVGYDVGGKTGTADIPGKGGYGHSGVLSSFLAVWPMTAPRYLSYVLLWDPKKTEADKGQTAAGLTAAPLTSRLISRVSPELGLAPAPQTGG